MIVIDSVFLTFLVHPAVRVRKAYSNSEKQEGELPRNATRETSVKPSSNRDADERRYSNAPANEAEHPEPEPRRAIAITSGLELARLTGKCALLEFGCWRVWVIHGIQVHEPRRDDSPPSLSHYSKQGSLALPLASQRSSKSKKPRKKFASKLADADW